MKIMVDIDGTICERDEGESYENSKPRHSMIDKINRLGEQNTIIYWTARGGNSGKDWHDLTKKQLKEWNAKHDELWMGKPPYDLIIDDKSMKIEEL